MKQEIKDTALQVLYSAPTTVGAFVSQLTIAERMALGLGTLQALYLLRKWWREETAFGLWMKRAVGVQPVTKPVDLDG